MKVAFLGPETSFSHEATLKVFPGTSLVEMHSIQNIFHAVSAGNADFGVVPIENITEGSVNTTLDLLLSNDLLILEEVFVDVNHCLLAAPNASKIEKIYSHPQAFAQCQKWLWKNYANIELVGTSSTASAASHAKEDKNSAAIASKNSTRQFGLRVLAEKIQDMDFNQTRFVVIGKTPARPAKTNKTTMFFAVKDRPGALFDCLKGFKDFGINLTRLESRPSKKIAWDYVFFVEFEGDLSEERVKDALAELKKHTTLVKFFGSYPRGA